MTVIVDSGTWVPPHLRHHVVHIEEVEPARLDHGVVIITKSDRYASKIADVAMHLWERRAAVVLVRARWVGTYCHPWSWPAHPASVVMDLDERGFAAIAPMLLSAFVGGLDVEDVAEPTGSRARWYRADGRVGVTLPQLRGMRRTAPCILVQPPEHEHGAWAQHLDDDYGIHLVEGREGVDHGHVLAFTATDKLPDPREVHRLRSDDLLSDARPFVGSLWPPSMLLETARVLAAAHLAHGDDDLTYGAVVEAARRQRGIPGDDEAEHATVLAREVVRLLGGAALERGTLEALRALAGVST
jgi:hypothetical protein